MTGMSQGIVSAADEPPAAECATIVTQYDWSEGDLGPCGRWDPIVDTIVRTPLETSAPMVHCHGAGYAMVGNDRFADLLGGTHPRSQGHPAADVMPEIWARPRRRGEVAHLRRRCRWPRQTPTVGLLEVQDWASLVVAHD